MVFAFSWLMEANRLSNSGSRNPGSPGDTETLTAFASDGYNHFQNHTERAKKRSSSPARVTQRTGGWCEPAGAKDELASEPPRAGRKFSGASAAPPPRYGARVGGPGQGPRQL